MTTPKPTISISVDVNNPGQFFACCGLLELADRLHPGAEGWFDADAFCLVAGELTEDDLLTHLNAADLIQLDPEDDMASPITIGAPFDLRLDWWADEIAGGKALKVWAGSMRSVRIAAAMKSAIADASASSQPIFDYAAVVYDPDNPKKKVEPFYYDARRGHNAKAIDIGFSPDAFNLTTTAFPAVEFLCLVGLQRCYPAPTSQRRVYTYHAWATPIPLVLVPAALSGRLPHIAGRAYRFENGFRTDQRKHKSFLPATPLEIRDER